MALLTRPQSAQFHGLCNHVSDASLSAAFRNDPIHDIAHFRHSVKGTGAEPHGLKVLEVVEVVAHVGNLLQGKSFALCQRTHCSQLVGSAQVHLFDPESFQSPAHGFFLAARDDREL